MLFDRSAKAKWRKELKNELKDLQKTFVAAGCDKAEVASCFRELQESLDLGEELHSNYKEARAASWDGAHGDTWVVRLYGRESGSGGGEEPKRACQ